MASLKNTVLNLHRLAGAANIAEACRVTAFSADRGLNMLTEHQAPGHTRASQPCDQIHRSHSQHLERDVVEFPTIVVAHSNKPTQNISEDRAPLLRVSPYLCTN
jgi:hypothetical protein